MTATLASRYNGCPVKLARAVADTSPMNPLVLPDADYKEVFERINQLALEYVASVNERPTFPKIDGSEAEALFAKSLPEKGMGAQALDDLPAVIASVRVTGPRFFGYVLGSGEPVGAAADLLASVLNQNVTAWRSSPSAVTIERVVVGWLAEAIGCTGVTGSLTGGGSSANLMGLAMAREARVPANQSGARPGTIYASEQVHMSIPKAVALLGIGRQYLRLIPCDDNFRIRVDVLRASMERMTSGLDYRRPSRLWVLQERFPRGASIRCWTWPGSRMSRAPGFTWTEPTALWPQLPNPRNLPD